MLTEQAPTREGENSSSSREKEKRLAGSGVSPPPGSLVPDVPTSRHGNDSLHGPETLGLFAPGHGLALARSNPPVFKTCPESVKVIDCDVPAPRERVSFLVGCIELPGANAFPKSLVSKFCPNV